MEIDLKPALDDAQLDQRLLRDSKEQEPEFLQRARRRVAPQKMIPVIVRRSGIPPEESATRSRASSARSARCSGAFVWRSRFRPALRRDRHRGRRLRAGDRPENHAVEAVPGLYFAGEIIDVDAYTGGFFADRFSTGYAAGSNL